MEQNTLVGLFDTHAHPTDDRFDEDRAEVLARMRAGNMLCMCVGSDMASSEQSLKLARENERIYAAVGVHPHDAKSFREEDIPTLTRWLTEEPKVKALGEIGLDFYWPDCPREIQYQALRDQLALARAAERPVVIHCRDAEEETLMTLEAEGFAGYPLLWHCFGQGPETARRILSNGWHISIPGPVTYKANEALREAVALIPADRLLLETDAPYLAPLPWRGKRNEPSYTVFTVRAMAEARGENPEDLWRTCGDNARRFFGLSVQE